MDKNRLLYAERHSSPEPEFLQKINRFTHTNMLKPRMLSGHHQGRMLSIFSRMKKPNYILEIGTYTGYSTYCLAEGLSENGKLISIDINEELPTQYLFQHSEFASKITFIVGDAKVIIPTLSFIWDIVFIDADKKNYDLYLDLTIPKINSGGILIIDNVLWDGKVYNDAFQDADTLAIRHINDRMAKDFNFETVMFTERDGLTICIKK